MHFLRHTSSLLLLKYNRIDFDLFVQVPKLDFPKRLAIERVLEIFIGEGGPVAKMRLRCNMENVYLLWYDWENKMESILLYAKAKSDIGNLMELLSQNREDGRQHVIILTISKKELAMQILDAIRKVHNSIILH
jgi:hypothetical protein